MCSAHGILDFIRDRLDESVEDGTCFQFTANQVWLKVKDCHAPDATDWQALTNLRCAGCWDHSYPCKNLKLMAESWSDHKDYDPNWRIE